MQQHQNYHMVLQQQQQNSGNMLSVTDASGEIFKDCTEGPTGSKISFQTP